MTSGDTRRMFLSSLVLAGGSVAAFSKSIHDGSVGMATPGDALFEHIQRQIARRLRLVRGPGGLLSAEDAATAAAFMRVCGMHARGLQLDDEARQILATRVATFSRDSLLNLPPDLTGLRARMRRKGLSISDRLVDPVTTSDVATRAAALQAVQEAETTGVCDRLAEALEMAAPKLAAGHGSLPRLAIGDESWCSFPIGQWRMCLSIAWYIASFEEPMLDGFVDALWSGFMACDALHLQRC
jgi:hypothetical protein